MLPDRSIPVNLMAGMGRLIPATNSGKEAQLSEALIEAVVTRVVPPSRIRIGFDLVALEGPVR